MPAPRVHGEVMRPKSGRLMALLVLGASQPGYWLPSLLQAYILPIPVNVPPLSTLNNSGQDPVLCPAPLKASTSWGQELTVSHRHEVRFGGEVRGSLSSPPEP